MLSTIDGCESAILAILTARAGSGQPLENVAITSTGPTKDEDIPASGELIFLTEVNGDDQWRFLGPGIREENYRIGLNVWVEQWGDDPAAAKTRMRALWAEVRDALVDDFRPGGGALLRAAGVLKSDGITYRQRSGSASPEKWGALCEAQIAFLARTAP
jgi:hypothetical protein